MCGERSRVGKEADRDITRASSKRLQSLSSHPCYGEGSVCFSSDEECHPLLSRQRQVRKACSFLPDPCIRKRLPSGRLWPCRSFGGDWRSVAGGRLLPPLPEDPGLQPVEIDIDDRRRIERENLRQGQAADDGVTERLANL